MDKTDDTHTQKKKHPIFLNIYLAEFIFDKWFVINIRFCVTKICAITQSAVIHIYKFNIVSLMIYT